MAVSGKEEQEKRKVIVDRLQLINTLKENREKHVKDFNEAISSYKELAIKKIETEYLNILSKIERKYKEVINNVSNLTKEEIPDQQELISICDRHFINLDVPTSYEKEYDAAIDIFEWDVRDQVELTFAEFNCFVRDEWEWKSKFNQITSFYNSSKMS